MTKTAAVLIPLAIFTLPTVFLLGYYFTKVITGKPTNLWRRSLSQVARPRRIVLLLPMVYSLIFSASLAWSAYVISDRISLSLLLGAGMVLTSAYGALRAWGLWKRAPQSFPDERSRQEWMSREMSRHYAPEMKFLLFLIKMTLVLMVASVLLMIIFVVVTLARGLL